MVVNVSFTFNSNNAILNLHFWKLFILVLLNIIKYHKSFFKLSHFTWTLQFKWLKSLYINSRWPVDIWKITLLSCGTWWSEVGDQIWGYTCKLLFSYIHNGFYHYNYISPITINIFKPCFAKIICLFHIIMNKYAYILHSQTYIIQYKHIINSLKWSL